MNGELLRAAVTGVYEVAHARHWQYGNSETLPPCADGIISCDRGAVSRPLWILGYHDQQQGGENVGSLDGWLVRHGFNRSYDPNDVRKNSIVLMRHVTEPVPDWKGHAFFVLENNNGMVWPLNEWDGKYEFFATYWWPEEEADGCIYLQIGD